MKYAVWSSLGILAIAAPKAEAANLAVITAPPTLLNIVICLVALAAAVLCWQVASVVKGGLLSKSWQIFTFAFALLAIGQAVAVAATIEVVQLPSFVVPAILVAMAGLFLYGVLETKRTLG
jgi:hypothetical protein